MWHTEMWDVFQEGRTKWCILVCKCSVWLTLLHLLLKPTEYMSVNLSLLKYSMFKKLFYSILQLHIRKNLSLKCVKWTIFTWKAIFRVDAFTRSSVEWHFFIKYFQWKWSSILKHTPPPDTKIPLGGSINSEFWQYKKLDQDFNYVKPQDWIKRRSGLQKRLDWDLLTTYLKVQILYTVVLIRVRYFALLNYTYKSW